MQGLNNRANAQANVGRNRVICSPCVQRVSCNAALGAGIGAVVGGITLAAGMRVIESNDPNNDTSFYNLGVFCALGAVFNLAADEVMPRIFPAVPNVNDGSTVASAESHQLGDIELQVQRRRSI
jgi:hypothetical protein